MLISLLNYCVRRRKKMTIAKIIPIEKNVGPTSFGDGSDYVTTPSKRSVGHEKTHDFPCIVFFWNMFVVCMAKTPSLKKHNNDY